MSVILVVTALAAPLVLHRTFTVFDDGSLRIDLRVQQVARRSPSLGNVMGTMTVTNNHEVSILLTNLQAEVTSGDLDVPGSFDDPAAVKFTTTLAQFRLPMLIPANRKVTTRFLGTVAGDLTSLTLATDFKVVAMGIAWTEILPDGRMRDFTTDVVTVCQDPLTSLQAEGGKGTDSCDLF